MKKMLFVVLVAAMLAMPANVSAAGKCAETVFDSGSFVTVRFSCTGDGSDGSIPNTVLSSHAMSILLRGFYLYTVTAYPTSGGTAPDAADVFILDAAGEDLLGSADGGTTANKGANLIHATLKKTTLPYSHYLSTHYYPAVTGALTLKVSSQGTASANYTVEAVFIK